MKVFITFLNARALNNTKIGNGTRTSNTNRACFKHRGNSLPKVFLRIKKGKPLISSKDSSSSISNLVVRKILPSKNSFGSIVL